MGYKRKEKSNYKTRKLVSEEKRRVMKETIEYLKELGEALTKKKIA